MTYTGCSSPTQRSPILTLLAIPPLPPEMPGQRIAHRACQLPAERAEVLVQLRRGTRAADDHAHRRSFEDPANRQRRRRAPECSRHLGHHRDAAQVAMMAE